MSNRVVRRSRSEAKELTRQRILNSAATVFASQGFNGATVRQIAEHAGYTTGALFAHFPTKDDLFLALLQDRYAEKLEAISELVADSGLSGLDDRFGRLQESEGDAALLATEFWLYAVRHPKAARQLSKLHGQLRQGVADLLRLYLPHLDAERSERLATAILAVGDGLGVQARIDPQLTTQGLFADSLAALIDGFGKPARTRR